MTLDARPRLTSILFEVTTRCNLECRYCYAPWDAPAPLLDTPPDPGFAAAERTLGRLFDVASVKRVTMTGGEPMLEERLPELALFCALRGAGVNVITNGTVGGRESYRQLMDVGVQLFQVPLLSADPSIHDGLTGGSGSWWRVMSSLSELRDLGAGVVVVVIVTRENAAGLGRILRLIAAMGLERVMLNRFNPGGRGLGGEATLALAPTELSDAFEVADTLAPELGLNITSNVGLPHCLVDPDDYRNIRFSRCSADIARRPLALDVTGGLRFCNHSPVVFGNIFDGPLTGVLDCAYLQRWRATVPEACADCTRFDRCFGGCRAASEQEGSSLGVVDPMLR